MINSASRDGVQDAGELPTWPCPVPLQPHGSRVASWGGRNEMATLSKS